MMEKFALHIIKANVIAALFILIVLLISHFIKGKYSSMWKYFMWLMISLSLLLPVNPLNHTAPVKLEVAQPNTVRLPAEIGQEPALPTPSRSGMSFNTQDSSVTISLSSSKISWYGLLQIFFLIWIAGIVILTIYKTALYRFSLGNLIRWSVPESDKKILEMYRYCCRKKHITKPPKLMVSPKLSSPVLAGLRETRLYIPKTNYSMEELQLVFYHELSHYKCRDLWYKMLILIVKTVYWFNPLLYKMAAEAEKDIENLCDSSVIEFCEKPERQLYSRLLLKTAAFQNHVPYLSTSLNDSTLVFKERILYMRNVSFLKTKMTPAILLSLALIGSNTLLGCAIGSSIPGTGSGFLPSGQDPDTVSADYTVGTSSSIFGSYDLPENSGTALPAANAATASGTKNTVSPSAADAAVPDTSGQKTTPEKEEEAFPFDQSTTVIATILSRSGESLGDTVTVQTQDGDVYTLATGWWTVSPGNELPVGSLAKVTFAAKEENRRLMTMYSYTMPTPEEQREQSISGVITAEGNGFISLQADNGSTYSFDLNGVRTTATDWGEGDHVNIRYWGSLQSPEVLDMTLNNPDGLGESTFKYENLDTADGNAARIKRATGTITACGENSFTIDSEERGIHLTLWYDEASLNESQLSYLDMIEPGRNVSVDFDTQTNQLAGFASMW